MSQDQEYAARDRADLQALLKSPKGRRVLWRIIRAAQTNQHGFVPGDANATAFHCGQKSIGLFVSEAVHEADPYALVQMRNEYESEIVSRQAKADKQTDEINLD